MQKTFNLPGGFLCCLIMSSMDVEKVVNDKFISFLISLFGKRPKLKVRKKVEKEKIIDNLLTVPITIIFKED